MIRHILATLLLLSICSTAADSTDETGFIPLFNGKDLTGWQGATTQYKVKDGKITLGKGHGGNLFTAEQYDNFILRFEFKLEAGTNNGLAIRWTGKGDPAWSAMELQILDNTAPKYAKLKEYQYHGSVYGAFPAKRGFLKPVGEWNVQEVIANASNLKITLNGTVILEADLSSKVKTRNPNRLKRTTGHIGFCGHNDPIEIRKVRIKNLPPAAAPPSTTKQTGDVPQ